MLYLYLLKRPEGTIGFDEFDSFVVSAKSHQAARKMLVDKWHAYSGDVVSERIGESYDREPRIILGSFNAG